MLVLRVTSTAAQSSVARSSASFSFLNADLLGTRAVQQLHLHLSGCMIINKQIRFLLCLFAVTKKHLILPVSIAGRIRNPELVSVVLKEQLEWITPIISFLHHRMKNSLFKLLFYVWEPKIIQLKILESFGHFCNTSMKRCQCLWDKYKKTACSNARCFSTSAQQAGFSLQRCLFWKVAKIVGWDLLRDTVWTGYPLRCCQPGTENGTFCNYICANIQLFC